MEQLARSFYSRTSMYAFFIVVLILISMYIATDGFAYVKINQMGYIIGTFVFAVGMTFRMASWISRPATRTMMKRSITNMKTKKRTKRNVRSIVKTAIDNIFLQKFIFKRGWYRGTQHFLIAWGCIGSFAITFGLVLGWMRFDPVEPGVLAVVAMNMPILVVDAHGWLATIFYNMLNITSIMLLIGLIMALIRRYRDRELRTTQRVSFDLFPLWLLVIVTVTGLLLTVSYKFLGGWYHSEMAYIHQISVVVLLVYFPFGKLVHFPIRPLATAVPMNYELQRETSGQGITGEGITREGGMIVAGTSAETGSAVAPAVDDEAASTANTCKGCGTVYSSVEQIEDVKSTLAQQAFDFQQEDGSELADYCLKCRRKMRVMKQMNIEQQHDHPYAPIDTNTGVSMPGFSRKKFADHSGGGDNQ